MMRRAVAVAIVVMLVGCSDNPGGPSVAPPPDPSRKVEASAKAPAPPGSRAARSAVTARPSVSADGMKTGLP